MTAKNGCLFAFASNFLTLGMLLNVGLSDQSVLKVNRRTNGDSFQVNTTAFCVSQTCQKYSADLTTSGLGSSCMCRCSGTILQPTRTFYDKISKCMTDRAIAKDNSCSVTAKVGSSSKSLSLLTIDSNVTLLKDNIKLNDIPKECQSIKASWSYYKNNAWITGEQNIFNVISSTESILSGKKIWLLQISTNFPKNLNGLLLKVSLQYIYKDGFNPRHCIMFKVLGRQKVTPTTSPSSASTVITVTTSRVSRTVPPTETNEVSYSTSPTKEPPPTREPTTLSTTIPINPKKDTSKDDKQQLLIAFAAGGVTLSLAVLIGCLGVFIYLRRKRKNKAKKASVARSRPSLPLPPSSPPHNYEYVVYPEFNENVPIKNCLDNASYGRGPDNELIIRTPAISIESLISKHTNNSSKSNHSIVSATLMTHDYAHLHDKDKSNDEGNSIYQPLIREQAPCDANDNETPCTLQDDEPKGYMEPCNNKVPEYMELEPVESEV